MFNISLTLMKKISGTEILAPDLIEDIRNEKSMVLSFH